MKLRICKAACRLVKYVMVSALIVELLCCGNIQSASAGNDSTTVIEKNDSGSKDTSGDKNDSDDRDESDYKDLDDKEYLTEKDLDKLKFAFTKDSYAVITYDTISASVETNIPGRFRNISYTISSPCITIDDFSNKILINIRGKYEGTTKLTAKVEVEYCDSNGEYEGVKTITSEADVKVLDSFEKTLAIGEQFTLEYKNYEEYAHMSYKLDKTGIAIISDDGVVTAAAEGFSKVFLTDGSRDIYIGSILVNGNDIELSEKDITRALGSVPYKLSLKNVTSAGTITWTSSNPAVAVVDSEGNVTPCSAGETVITAVFTTLTGISSSYTCTFRVTSPMLNITSCNLARDYSVELKVTGTTGEAVWSTSDSKIASVYSASYSSRYSYVSSAGNSEVPSYLSASVYGNKKGMAEITVQVDGITLKCNITVTNPVLKKSFYVVTKGTKVVLKLTGTNTASEVKFSSTNKKVATVNSKGIVSTKGKGYATINIEVDHAVKSASINVGSAKAVKAVNTALKAEGAKYSQARRMQKGYYDCSSLVWRSYSPYKMYFGDRSYAPVAANEAKYCVKHKMSVPLKYLKNLNKLQPGDLLFMKRSRNGRYKNIYHVAIYIGQEGYDNYTYGRIVHADGRRVSQSSIYNVDNIVVIGRPFK